MDISGMMAAMGETRSRCRCRELQSTVYTLEAVHYLPVSSTEASKGWERISSIRCNSIHPRFTTYIHTHKDI